MMLSTDYERLPTDRSAMMLSTGYERLPTDGRPTDIWLNGHLTERSIHVPNGHFAENILFFTYM